MVITWDSLGCDVYRLGVNLWSKWFFLSDLEVDFVSEANLVLLLTLLNSYAIAVFPDHKRTLFSEAEPD